MVVDADDLLKSTYAFEDVVLPLPGSRALYPANDVADVYHDLAKRDAISLTKCVHSAKEFSITSMTGGYRHVFQRPMDFKWELLSYTDSNVPLVETDWDIISKSRSVNTVEDGLFNGMKPATPKHINQLEDLNGEIICAAGNNEVEDREKALLQGEPSSSFGPQSIQMALKLGFTLPSSCYATMAMRELLKTSTSAAFQKTLNP